ncbi:hypothetical protein LTR08_000123 [Meristemomyces frigidus]|nr:hypothetical protein LTR08_000123 [Meristemomyces frigidus]
MDRQRIIRFSAVTALTLAALFTTLALLQHLLVPALVWWSPQLETSFYDLGFFGAYRAQSYVSFNLTSPQASILQWEDSCDNGYIFLDPSGKAPKHPGPLILDAKGNLVWTSDQFKTTTNLKLQRYQGADYLTFWSGKKAQTMGTGAYYMMDSNYTVVRKVDAVGEALHGDLHEFKITKDDTALLTVYNLTNADLTGMGWFRTDHGWITDSIFQEVDIATGALLFEWKATDHFRAEGSYMTNPLGGYYAGNPFDFFHINSVEKDAHGNYLISSRHFHTVMCIDGQTGDVLWQLGGRSTDFRDLSQGKASDFSWQHDARWLSEEDGLLSLFDNGVAWPHVDVPYSEGRIIHIDVTNRTATLLHSYRSLASPRSSSQGSVQPISGAHGEDHIFVGWGSSAAYSEHAMDGQLLCETHFAAAVSFWWERVKSYRAFKASAWSATPAAWDPSAKIEGSKLFVSWNGATDVAFWELQGCEAAEGEEGGTGEFHALDITEKHAFEESFSLPTGAASMSRYRVAALDRDHAIIRHSNVAVPPPSSRYMIFLITGNLAAVCVAAVVGYWVLRRRAWHVDWKQYTVDRSKYQKLW